jgi:hypothetical protein
MGYYGVLVFYLLTLYKQLIILHYGLGLVKSENIYESDLFSKIIIQTFTKSTQSYNFYFFLWHISSYNY